MLLPSILYVGNQIFTDSEVFCTNPRKEELVKTDFNTMSLKLLPANKMRLRKYTF